MDEWFSHHADTVGTQVQRGFESHRHNETQMYRAKLISWIFVVVVEDVGSNPTICTLGPLAQSVRAAHS